MKKTHSQPSPSVTGPPISSPEVAPTPPIPPQMPSALLRSWPFVEHRRQERQRGGSQDRRCNPLQHPGGDEDLIGPGEPAQERRRCKERYADHEHAAAPEQVGGPATEQQEPPEGEQVGAHHPLQSPGREAERLVDARQGDVDDRPVEDHHEERGPEQRQRQPAPGIRVARPSTHSPTTRSRRSRSKISTRKATGLTRPTWTVAQAGRSSAGRSSRSGTRPCRRCGSRSR